MLINFCNLLQHDANAIVMYNGVSGQKKLGNFQSEHWKDTFAQWQKHHPNCESTKQVMVLLLSQQDCINYATWACCCYTRWLDWLMNSFKVKMLQKELFEPVCSWMEHEAVGKISIKGIPELTDVPKYKA